MAVCLLTMITPGRPNQPTKKIHHVIIIQILSICIFWLRVISWLGFTFHGVVCGGRRRFPLSHSRSLVCVYINIRLHTREQEYREMKSTIMPDSDRFVDAREKKILALTHHRTDSRYMLSQF
jgi:hypothetical protein